MKSFSIMWSRFLRIKRAWEHHWLYLSSLRLRMTLQWSSSRNCSASPSGLAAASESDRLAGFLASAESLCEIPSLYEATSILTEITFPLSHALKCFIFCSETIERPNTWIILASKEWAHIANRLYVRWSFARALMFNTLLNDRQASIKWVSNVCPCVPRRPL